MDLMEKYRLCVGLHTYKIMLLSTKRYGNVSLLKNSMLKDDVLVKLRDPTYVADWEQIKNITDLIEKYEFSEDKILKRFYEGHMKITDVFNLFTDGTFM